MLRRKVTEQLAAWKDGSTKALLIAGARQIGKSYAIRELGRDAFGTYFEANLLLDADARDTLIGARNASDNPLLHTVGGLVEGRPSYLGFCL